MKRKVKKIPEMTFADIKRFMDQTKLMPNGCVYWTGQKRRGYGRFALGNKRFPAHRVAFKLSHGYDLPPSWVVMHACDNKPCVAGWHLGPGTHKDNMADRDKKKRTLQGEQVKSARLTNAQASELKLSILGGASVQQMSAKYSLPEATVYNIAVGRSFKYVEPLGDVLKSHYQQVDWRQAERMKMLREQKLTLSAIAMKLNLKRGTVFDVLKNERKKHVPPMTDGQAIRLHLMVLRYGLSKVSAKTWLSRKTILKFSARVICKEAPSESTSVVQAPSIVPEQPQQAPGAYVQELRGAVDQAQA